MEATGRSWRIAVVLGVLGISIPAGLALRPSPELPPVSSAAIRSRPAEPGLDLARLYDLDHLVIDGDPLLDLDRIAPVGAGKPVAAAVPEPAAPMLWILGLTMLYTLYLPARSW